MKFLFELVEMKDENGKRIIAREPDTFYRNRYLYCIKPYKGSVEGFNKLKSDMDRNRYSEVKAKDINNGIFLVNKSWLVSNEMSIVNLGFTNSGSMSFVRKDVEKKKKTSAVLTMINNDYKSSFRLGNSSLDAVYIVFKDRVVNLINVGNITNSKGVNLEFEDGLNVYDEPELYGINERVNTVRAKIKENKNNVGFIIKEHKYTNVDFTLYLMADKLEFTPNIYEIKKEKKTSYMINDSKDRGYDYYGFIVKKSQKYPLELRWKVYNSGDIFNNPQYTDINESGLEYLYIQTLRLVEDSYNVFNRQPKEVMAVNSVLVNILTEISEVYKVEYSYMDNYDSEMFKEDFEKLKVNLLEYTSVDRQNELGKLMGTQIKKKFDKKHKTLIGEYEKLKKMLRN